MIKKLAFILAGFVLFFSGFIFSGGSAFASEDKLYGADASFEDTDLTLEEMLTYTLESQYLTNYMNSSIVEKFGNVRPYDTLVENNKKNISELEILFYIRNLSIPEDMGKDHFTPDSDFNQNLEISYENEMKNIVMYETFLNKEIPEDFKATLQLLETNSKKNLENLEISLSEISGTQSKTTIDNNIVTRFFNWLGRSFDSLFN